MFRLGGMPTVHLLDYVAGNVRSLVNAIEKIGYTVEWIKEPKDVDKAEVDAFKLGARLEFWAWYTRTLLMICRC